MPVINLNNRTDIKPGVIYRAWSYEHLLLAFEKTQFKFKKMFYTKCQMYNGKYLFRVK